MIIGLSFGDDTACKDETRALLVGTFLGKVDQLDDDKGQSIWLHFANDSLLSACLGDWYTGSVSARTKESR